MKTTACCIILLVIFGTFDPGETTGAGPPSSKRTKFPKRDPQKNYACVSEGTGFYVQCGLENIIDLPSQTPQECCYYCMYRDYCRSFSFSHTTNECFISSTVKEKCLDVKQEDGFSYFEIV